MINRLRSATVLTACLSLFFAATAFGQEPETSPLPGRDAPAGLMDTMLHTKGEWMFGIRAMGMGMDTNRDGTRKLTDADVRAAGYEQVPQNMKMFMGMFDVMYGVNHRVTLTATIPLAVNSMDMLADDGSFTMHSHGIGDARVGALIGLWSRGRQTIHLRLATSVPIGTVNAIDNMPGCAGCKVDYPMQLGSGTWDFEPALTWVGDSGPWSWGATWTETLRTGTNSQQYTLGNRHEGSFWGVRHVGTGISASARVAVSVWGNIDGADPDLDPMMAPTQDPTAQGGRRVDWFVGLGWDPGGRAREHRLAVEVGAPAWQSLDGPQLGTNWSATLSWQFWVRQ